MTVTRVPLSHPMSREALVEGSGFHAPGEGVFVHVQTVAGGHGAWFNADEADQLIAAVDRALDREPIPLREELVAFAEYLTGTGWWIDESDVDTYLVAIGEGPTDTEEARP